jgi:hypothetical protein
LCYTISPNWETCQDDGIAVFFKNVVFIAFTNDNYGIGTNLMHSMALADESDGNDDVDWMDDMVADIGRWYNLESKDPPPEVQNFYRLLATSEEKVHDDTNMTVL